MTPFEGVDYSSDRPDPALLKKAGIKFAVRYITPSGVGRKGIDQAEFDALRRNGISVVAVWEGTARDPLAGRAQGIADARAAQAGLEAIDGLADTAPVYLAIDWDANPTELAGPITAYFRGAATVLGSHRVGVYGGARQVKYIYDNALAAWAWQTYAWSAGALLPYAHLHQYLNDVPLAGGTVDRVRAYQPVYGQHGVTRPAKPVKEPTMQTVDDTIRLTRAGQILEHVACRRIIVQAPRVVIRDVEVYGDPSVKSNHGLIDFTHAAASGTITDAVVKPRKPTLWQTGVLGHDYTATRVTVRHTVDGFGIYDTHKPKDGRVDVIITDCDVDQLAYFINDPNHSDRRTHNDAVQIQGGSHITIKNSRLHAITDDTVGDGKKNPYRPAATGQAVAVTPNVSKVTWLHVEGCDLDGGAQSVTVIPGKFGGANVGTFTGNTFGRRQKNKRAAAAHPAMVVGWKRNVYADGGEAKLAVTTNL